MWTIFSWFLQSVYLIKGSFGELFLFFAFSNLLSKYFQDCWKWKFGTKKKRLLSFTGHDIIYCYNAKILISDNKIQTFSFIFRPLSTLETSKLHFNLGHVRAGWYLEDYKCKWLLNYYPSKAQNFILCLWEFSIGFAEYGASPCLLLRPFFTQLHSF